jgi:NADPH:quinone reductase-like Zn-dependent oxidoreductase
MYTDITLRMVIVYAMPEEAKIQAIEDISRALAIQSLKHRVAHRLALNDISRSHQLVEQGGFGGCVVLTME